ncbi:MAG: Glu/Leu/Phe/Val family dehydrogenase [Alphaproteobacteria bacterium]
MALTFTYPDVSGHEDFDNHETVLKAEDPEIGFKAFIAIHNTINGPARGGCRYWPHYEDENAALKDVLRLSKGMTYKTTLAGLPFGGGKTVIVGPAGTERASPEIMRALGHMLNELNGLYETGEDVGTRTSDFVIAGEVTEHVRVKAVERAGALDLPGGPPLYTAYGIYYGIKSAARAQFGSDDLSGKKIAVKGLGNVSEPLCKMLYADGADLMFTDIADYKMELALKDMPNAKTGSVDNIMFEDVDIYVPCALGGDINDDTIDKIKARVIAGAANNQLAKAYHAQKLHERGILYAPDYAINAGGVINVVMIGLTHEEMLKRVQVIGTTLDEIFARSESENTDTASIADTIVQERLAMASNSKIAANGH